MPRTAKRVRAATSPAKLVPAFGELLRELRGATRSVEEVLITLRAKAPRIHTNQGTVSGYEQGYNKKPDPIVLWGLAKAYGVSLDGLLAVLHANRLSPQLSIDEARRVLSEQSHGPSSSVAAGALETAEARLFEAAAELARVRDRLHTGQKPRG